MSARFDIAALMALIAIAHYADDETGVSRITYSDVGEKTGLSRAKLAGGLNTLKRLNLIETEAQVRSH